MPSRALLAAEAWPAAGDGLPTLTEVVEWQAPAAPVLSAEPLAASAAALATDVLRDLEQHIGALFEARLRDALAPALARAADGLIRDAQKELSAALTSLVDDAVARAIERQPRR